MCHGGSSRRLTAVPENSSRFLSTPSRDVRRGERRQGVSNFLRSVGRGSRRVLKYLASRPPASFHLEANAEAVSFRSDRRESSRVVVESRRESSRVVESRRDRLSTRYFPAAITPVIGLAARCESALESYHSITFPETAAVSRIRSKRILSRPIDVSLHFSCPFFLF